MEPENEQPDLNDNADWFDDFDAAFEEEEQQKQAPKPTEPKPEPKSEEQKPQ